MQRLALIATVFLCILLADCGPHERDASGIPLAARHLQTADAHSAPAANEARALSDSSWIRSAPVDVLPMDRNGDGYVYQDRLDFQVIADTPGNCPICGMGLQKTSVADAVMNLMDHNIAIVPRRIPTPERPISF